MKKLTTLNLTIIQKLFIFFVIAALLGIIPFLSVMYVTVKPKIENLAFIDINYKTQNIATNLQRQLDYAQTLAISLARMGENLSLDVETDKQDLFRFLNQAKNNLEIAGGGIWPEEYMYQKDKKLASFFWGRDKENNFIFVNDYNNESPKNYHDEDWYTPLKNAKKDTINWSQVYKDPYTNVAMVTVSVGIYKENKFVGISTIDVALTGLEEVVESQTNSFNGYAYLVDTQYNIIVSKGIDKGNIKLKDYHNASHKQKIFVYDSDYDSTFKEASKMMIFKFEKVAWTLVVAMPNSYIYRNPIDIGLTMLVTLIMIFLLIVFFSYLVLQKILIKPLSTISEELEEIDDKNHSRKYLTIYGSDELSTLSKSFNETSKNLYSALSAKSQFLANMSHEIRTPLNAIIGFIELTKKQSKDTKIDEYMKTACDSSKGLLHIIEDILDFSKIESGKLEIDKVNFSIRDELNTVSKFFDERCADKDISLLMKIDDNVPTYIHADSLRLKQILINLISNAIKFTGKGKTIELVVKYENSMLNISLKDQGKGIAEDKLEHIFELFNQEDNSTTRKYGGTGLGLSISKNLAKIMGGDLNVKSKLGEGSEFYFFIPVSIAEKSDESSEEFVPHTFKGKKVLVVEDNKSNQLFIKIILEEIEFDIDIASDGVLGVDAFKKNKYDIVLMDENMPNMNGIEATKIIKQYEKEKNLNHTPIIALTANALKGDREIFIQAGMDEYISKPIDIEKLNKILLKFLSNS